MFDGGDTYSPVPFPAKQYKCTACGYRGEGIVVTIKPPRAGLPDPSGVYCPYCDAVWRFFRNGVRVEEVKQGA
jgi:hypothetical protein